MKKDPLKLLNEAHNEFGKARGKLSNALRAWLEPYNFPAEIEQGFEIWFTSGGENIVTKNGRCFTNSTMSTAVNWGKMCLTEDEFLNEAIREIRLFEKEERK